MLRRRYNKKKEAARKAERGQKAYASGGQRFHTERGVYVHTQNRRGLTSDGGALRSRSFLQAKMRLL